MVDLAILARRVLPPMWQPGSRLFCHKVKVGRAGDLVYEGRNPLYSAIALLGLLEDERSGGPSAGSLVGNALDHLYALHTSQSGVSLGACLIWAGALAEDRRAADVLLHMDGFSPRRASNMDLGLLLAGLSNAHALNRPLRDRMARVIPGLRDELLRRFSPSAGLFRGRSPGRLTSFREGKLTSFASQTYPVHGLAELARCVEGSVRRECVVAAERLVAEQGAQGQWWWQFSSDTGRPIDGYPVYTVHQDGMAFMALATLHNLGEGNYYAPLALGLRWILGENELGESLVNKDPELLFRCIQRQGSDPDGISGMSRRARLRAILSSVGLYRSAGSEAARDSLVILRECRPYHLGWVLYAHSLVRGW